MGKTKGLLLIVGALRTGASFSKMVEFAGCFRGSIVKGVPRLIYQIGTPAINCIAARDSKRLVSEVSTVVVTTFSQ